jgi:hypothetical protein
VLYRSMKAAPDGRPELGPSARTLGARPEDDILVVANIVRPGTGGMSVAPGAPRNLPRHRRPPELNGVGRDPVWQVGEETLDSELVYRPDPDDPDMHGFVEPARAMRYSEYVAALERTRELWRRL